MSRAAGPAAADVGTPRRGPGMARHCLALAASFLEFPAQRGPRRWRHAPAWRWQRHFWSLRPNWGLDGGGAVLGRRFAKLGASVLVRAPCVPVRGRAARSARISMWTGAWSAVGAPASILAPKSPTKPRI